VSSDQDWIVIGLSDGINHSLRLARSGVSWTTLDGMSHRHAPTRARPKLLAINNRRPGLATTRGARHQDRLPVCH